MPAKRIIPCLDVKDGRVVKGVKFQNLRDAGDPVEAAARYDEQGADEVTYLDIAATQKNPGLVDRLSRLAGAQALVVAIDVKRRPRGAGPQEWEVHVAGGSRPTGVEGLAWAREVAERGAGELLLTSMDRDGTQAGYDLELLEKVCGSVTIPVIASGGVGTLEHLAEGLRFADAALAASIFHDGKHTVQEAKAYLLARGIDVRP